VVTIHQFTKGRNPLRQFPRSVRNMLATSPFTGKLRPFGETCVMDFWRNTAHIAIFSIIQSNPIYLTQANGPYTHAINHNRCTMHCSKHA